MLMTIFSFGPMSLLIAFTFRNPVLFHLDATRTLETAVCKELHIAQGSGYSNAINNKTVKLKLITFNKNKEFTLDNRVILLN